MVEFRILGPLEVRHDGRAVELGGPRNRALLAALLVHAGEPVSVDALAQAVWGDEAPPGATRSVQVQVSRLRHALGPVAARIDTVAGGYRLHVEPDELDADRFEQIYARACTVAPSEAAAELRAALAMWRGPALVDVRYEPWAQGAIRRLDELRAVAVEERVEADLARGEHARLVGELEALVAEHPLRERLRGQQMRALYRAGRHADALAAFRDARAVLDAELGLEPSPELRRLEQAILTHDPAIAGGEVPARAVPELPTPTFGRDDDIRAIVAALADVRLLTLTGPGGVGKTRLAIEVARTAGGHFVSLASTADAARVPAVICDALAVARVPGEPDAAALDRALSRGPVLLVLDNLEHLPDAAAPLAALLERHAGLRLLATSRQPLHVKAERVVPVAPLEPGAGTDLFADRARANDPAFALTDDNRAAVATVCRRLGGLPLAIELAAARLSVLTPAALAERLDDALRILDRGPGDAPERQRTLRATLDWSFELLDEDEQAAFTALGAFAGGCELDAAEAVADTGLPVLEGLVVKSLVTAQEGRLTLLEPVRQYAAERLAARPDADSVHRLHLAHYAALAERCDQAIWVRQRSCPEFTIMSREHDNLRAAVAWGLRAGEARRVLVLLSATCTYMWYRLAASELRDSLDRAFAEAGTELPPRERARALLAFGNTWFDTPGFEARVGEALALFRSLDDDAMSARCLIVLSSFLSFAGRYADARAASQEALVHAQRVADDALIGESQAGIAIGTEHIEDHLPLAREAIGRLRAAGAHQRATMVLASLSFVALSEDECELAAQLGREALDGGVALGDPWTIAFANGNIGLATLLGGDYDAAGAAFRDELAAAQANVLGMFLFEGLLGFAALAAADGADRRAAMLDAASRALAERPIAGSELLAYGRVQQRFIAPARDRLGEAAWSAAEAAGAAMTADDAVAFALASDRDQARRPVRPFS